MAPISNHTLPELSNLQCTPKMTSQSPISQKHYEAEPSTEAPPPGKAEQRAEDTFDWNAKPGPAKFAAFMEAFPAEKYGGPAYVPTYPPQKK